jgi:Cu+-exporting ATPase
MHKCQFCKQPIDAGFKTTRDGNDYCCTGCATADAMLGGSDQEGPSVKLIDRYSHLSLIDHKEGLDKINGNHWQWTIQLPGIHCTSCLILLERMGEWLPGVRDVRVAFSAKQAVVQFDPEMISVSRLAAWLDFVGYPPSIITQKKKTTSGIAELGITGFAMGNAMMSAFPEYFGLSEETNYQLLYFFRYSTAFFATISLVVAGKFYLINAYKAVRNRQWSLDIPIALGMLALWVWSAHLLFTGQNGGYFDSLSGLIFFLILGRFLQGRTYAAFSFERTVDDFLPISVFSLTREEFVRLGDLKEGEEYQIPTEGIVPVKSILMGKAELDYSFITGESELQQLYRDQTIFAGARNAGSTLIAKVLQAPSQSEVEGLWKSKDRETTGWVSERITATFTISVLIISVLATVVWWFLNPERAIEIGVSVLIIACPCALSLAAPFAYGTASKLLSDMGLYMKSGLGIEKLAAAQRFFWDKTGTLTERASTVNITELSEGDKSVFRAMVGRSSHPVSRLLAQYLQEGPKATLSRWEEHVGKGIEAEFEGQTFALGSAQWLNTTGDQTVMAIEGHVVGGFGSEFSYRANLTELFQAITDLGGEHALISGDHPRELPRNWSKYFEGKSHFNKSPEQKSSLVQGQKNAVFLGDGLNDVKAMESADLGIAVVENSMSYIPKSGGVLLANQLLELPAMIRYSRRVRSLVKWAYMLSLLYNLSGVALALFGALSPVVAAILMPLSSISVVLFVVLGARALK